MYKFKVSKWIQCDKIPFLQIQTIQIVSEDIIDRFRRMHRIFDGMDVNDFFKTYSYMKTLLVSNCEVMKNKLLVNEKLAR